jgi:hypothetical protein
VLTVFCDHVVHVPVHAAGLLRCAAPTGASRQAMLAQQQRPHRNDCNAAESRCCRCLDGGNAGLSGQSALPLAPLVHQVVLAAAWRWPQAACKLWRHRLRPPPAAAAACRLLLLLLRVACMVQVCPCAACPAARQHYCSSPEAAGCKRQSGCLLS